MISRLFHRSVIALLLAWPARGAEPAAPPYPPSPTLQGAEVDFTTHKRLAPGSDNWPTTWANDGHLYTAWGDGGGFGGTNGKGRVSLGVARVEGGPSIYTGHNVWGGVGAQHPVQFEGKSYGLLCVGGVLHMWVAHQPNPHLAVCQLASSKDHGATWQMAGWNFRYADQLTVPTFLNFGRDYAGARDGYVYSYFIQPTWGPGNSQTGKYGFDVHKPGRIHLARVPMESILERSRYEFFAGRAGDGTPAWSADLAAKQPIFEDPNGVGWNLSVSYHPGLKRYFLTTEHGETHAGKFGLFDAPEPWGPWTTVAYDEQWGAGHIEVSTFYWNFPTKWFAADNTRFTLLFTGKNTNDSWNSVEGKFVPRYLTTQERPVKFTGEQEARMRDVRAYMDSVVFPKVSLSSVSYREAFDWVQKSIRLHAPAATPVNERGISMVLKFRGDKPERVNVSLSAATLPQVLDAICSQHDYVWKLESYALSVIPREDLRK